ncbi:MAG: hypothetical protein QM774_13000 [Gordonia sp. (in: high G+C Gram-positive bacteria)]|uniref:hypothetical protein n=1 Tax=Gordonia sp. (in: high G+C Gram-positive bacteria) TaxID=84139 RepID=UPI0039E2E80E
MAQEPDPDSRPISVDELMARKNSDPDAFPRSSGMPAYTPPATGAQRVVGASGMPAYTAPATGQVPIAAPAPSTAAKAGAANVVTGIIPVDAVADSDHEQAAAAVAGTVAPVEPDDLLGEDLPAMEVHDDAALAAPATGAVPVAPATGAVPVAPATGAVPVAATAAAAAVAATETETDEATDKKPGKLDWAARRAAKKAAKQDDAETVADEAVPAATALLGSSPASAAADTDTHPVVETTTTTAPAAAPAETPATEPAADLDLDEDDDEDDYADHERSPLLQWLGLIGEVVLGLAVGAGLFWGFTILWKQYVYFALVLAVLVIFAIVTFAHILRKRDLPTTLLALAVGLLVTIGPLVMLV